MPQNREYVSENGSDAPRSSGERDIRVLCIDYSIGFGGATKSTALMLRSMAGVSPIVLSSQEPGVRQLWFGSWRTYRLRRWCNYHTRWRLEEQLEQWNVRPSLREVVMKGYALLDNITGILSALRIAFLAKWHRVDLVHLANGFMPPEGLLAGRLARVPTLAHMRGFFAPWDRKHIARGRPQLVLGDSRAVTNSFVETYGSSIPSMTLYEVVDVDALGAAAEERDLHRRQLALSPEDVAVGLFGRIMRWKGQKEFVVAMIAAMERDPTLVGVLVGDAPDGGQAYYDSVKELITGSGFEQRFRLAGYVEDVEPLYAAMDVVVHASIEPEPCGMVIMEGMAASRPVIAADAGGPTELVRHGVDGYLVPPGDCDAMASAILKLSEAPELRRSMGAAGHERARSLFDVPIAAARLRQIYERLVAEDLSALGDRETAVHRQVG